MGPNVDILPEVIEALPISPRFTPYNFSPRCKFTTLTTRRSMVEFLLTYILTLSATGARIKILLCFGGLEVVGRW